MDGIGCQVKNENGDTFGVLDTHETLQDVGCPPPDECEFVSRWVSYQELLVAIAGKKNDPG